MTTPTQAQIEAAAQAIFTARMLRNDGQWDCQTEAKAALTAAAQVGEQFNIDDAVTDYLKKDRNATIERCAQVAQKELLNGGADVDDHWTIRRANRIAAAIRKLKDEAHMSSK